MKNSQICEYYLQGRCRFGDKCFKSHDHTKAGLIQGFMIRHAQSQFNRLAEYFPNQSFKSEECKKHMQLNPQLIDCSLSQKGLEQAGKTRLPVKEVDIVFVSPLTRTLQTAEKLITANKLKTQHVIVLPELTQVLSKVCDFGSSIKQKRKKYPGFNFGQFDRFLKQNNHIQGEEGWQDLLVDSYYNQQIQTKLPFGERYLYILENIFPTPLENSQRCFNRSLRALSLIKYISKQLKASKVIIVSHNRVLRYIDGRNNQGRVTSFANCQIRPIIF